MKSVNYALLLMVSPFIIAGCGGSSSPSLPAQEASVADIATQMELPTSNEDDMIAGIIADNTVANYRKADWIPSELQSQTSSGKLSSSAYKLSSKDVISSKMISNGDSTTGWVIYDADPAGASISSKYDETRGSNVVCLVSDGLKNGAALGWTAQDWADASTNKLNDTVNNTIKWSMKFDEDYMVYVRVSTKNGYRYLYYTASNQSLGVEQTYDAPHYIHNGLGSGSKDGTWRTFTRNLSADLKRFDPSNEINSIDGFFVRGSGCIDDVELLKTDETIANEIIYEDAKDGQVSRWAVYDDDPAGASIENVDDEEKSSKVISVCGTGLENGFILGAWDSENGWKNSINKEISWDMKFNDKFVIYLSVITEEGHRFITYSPLSDETYADNPNDGGGIVTKGGYTYIHLGLNPNTRSGSWQTVTRNLEADLKRYEPSNSIVSVTSYLVRGCGKLDNIKMFDSNPNGDNATN